MHAKYKYRGFRKYWISWGLPFFLLIQEIPYFGLFFNAKFQFDDSQNVRYSQKFGISESGTSENLCNREL